MVLIDFGAEDLEFLPRLFARPDFSVRLVLDRGANPATDGIAAACGANLSRDIADITRQVFDLALLGSRAARGVELEFLLGAMGTPVRYVTEFLEEEGDEAPPAGSLGPDWLLGDRVAPPRNPASHRMRRSGDVQPPDASTGALEPGDMPHPGDPAGIERALERWAAVSGASTAEIHGGDADAIQWVCRSGPEDPLLVRLASLAFELDEPQAVTRLDGDRPGAVWAAWPLPMERDRAVLAVAGIGVGAPRTAWAKIERTLREAWRPRVEPPPPSPLPPPPIAPPGTIASRLGRGGWLDVATFEDHLLRAIELQSAGGRGLVLLRLALADRPDLAERLGRMLLDRMPDVDSVCRPSPGTLVMMLDRSPSAPIQARQRVVALWHACWHEQGLALPAPALEIREVEQTGPADALEGLEAVSRWLSWGVRPE